MSKEKFFDLVELSNSSPSPFEGEKKYISTGDVDDNGINLNTAIDITYDNRPTRANVQCKSGDVLIAKMAETNKVILIDDINSNYIYSTGFLCVTPKLNRLTSRYLYYLVTCPQFLIQKDKQSAGSTQKAINNKWFSKIFVDIPDLSEQQFDVEILDKINSLLKKVNKCIDLCDFIVKSQFIKMFDPLSNKYNYPVVDISQISKSYFAGGDKPTVFSKNQSGSCIYPVYANGEDNAGLQGFTNKYRVDEKALTISARGSIGFSCIREPKFTPIVRLITIVPNDRINISYLKYLFDYSVVRSNGSSQQQFTIPELKKMSFILAPINKQDEFASFVNQIDKSKFRLKQLQEKLDILYKSLLQKYFG